MITNREQLISELSSDLTASSRAGRTVDMVACWLVFNFIVAALLIYVTGPYREGSLQQVQEHPQFLIESLTGLLTIFMLSASAFRSGIPAAVSRLKRFTPALVLVFIWLGFYVVGLWSPALEPSTQGARESLCYVEAIIYGLPSLILGMYLIGRLWPLHGAWTGMQIGLAAGATPALIMQFACMYMPAHIITHHLIPGLLLGLAGVIAGKFYLAK